MGPLVHRLHARPGRRRRRQKVGAEEPSDYALGRSRSGFGSKIHLASCANGVSLGAVVMAGRRHASTQFEALAVDRCVSWLKEWRGLATRYDKLAGTFLAVVHLAKCRRFLRLLDLRDRI